MNGPESSLLVSGWRFIPHSFAVFAQFASLALLRRGAGPRLCFEDRPYYNPAWRPQPGLFDAGDESALRAIPAPAPGVAPDAELRCAFPCELLRAPLARRTLAFCTSEFLTVPPAYAEGGGAFREAQQRHGIPILTRSNWAKEGFVRSGVPAEAVTVLPLGVEPRIYRPATDAQRARIRAEVGFAEDDVVFLHVGAMSPNKGLRYLLPAFAELLRARPKARLLLKGMDGFYASNAFVERELQALDPALAQAAAARLSYVGAGLSFAEMARVYQSADCYVSPYLGEGFNLPVLEAAACGLPVICTAGGATDDFVTDAFALRIASKLRPMAIDGVPEAMGLLPDRHHLLELMRRAMDDAAFRCAAREAGPAHAAARHSWDQVADGLLSVLGLGS